MNRNHIFVLLIITLMLLLSACSWKKQADVPDIVIDAVEDMHDDVKKNIKETVNDSE